MIGISHFLFAWSDDPFQNTQISTLTGEQAIPKIAVTGSGDFFVGYFSNEAGNYNVRLQRVFREGDTFWQPDGLLISEHPQMTWLTDWDMKVDNEDCAIIAFQDIRNNGNNNIYVYKTDFGYPHWGEAGIELSNSSAFDVSPKIGILESGNVVVSWQSEEKMYVQKISPEGDLLFGEQGILLNETGVSLSWPQIIPMEDDEFVLKYFKDSGPVWSPTRHIFAKKFAVNGDVIWTSTISNAGGISAWTQILPIAKDENNGFFIAWHEDRNFTNITNSFIQHIDNDGNPTFTENGILLSHHSSYHQFYPKISYLANSEEVVIIWNEMDGSQNNRGIFGQKINMNGDLLWGNNGTSFIPLELTDIYPVALEPLYNGAVCFYTNNNFIYAFRINENGDFIWENAVISSNPSLKTHIEVSEQSNQQWVAVWGDSRNGNTDIYAQNLFSNGDIGAQPAVSLLHFSLLQEDNQIHLKWLVEWENNMFYYYLYRSESNDLSEAICITRIDAVNSNSEYEYEVFDEYNLVNGQTYFYWLESVQVDGESTFYEPASILYESSSTDISVLHNKTFLTNFPNPFNPTTTIQFSNDQNQQNEQITLEIYNIKGQKIRQFKISNSKFNINEVVWDGRDELQNPVSSGIYLYQIKSCSGIFGTKKMMLVK
jgi:hypothetical protein